MHVNTKFFNIGADIRLVFLLIMLSCSLNFASGVADSDSQDDSIAVATRTPIPFKGQILFALNDDILVTNPAGSMRANITGSSLHNLPYYHPSATPDGNKVACVAGEGVDAEIYVLTSDGKKKLRVTNNNMQEADPNISRDGSKVIFARKDADTGSWFLVMSEIEDIAWNAAKELEYPMIGQVLTPVNTQSKKMERDLNATLATNKPISKSNTAQGSLNQIRNSAQSEKNTSMALARRVTVQTTAGIKETELTQPESGFKGDLGSSISPDGNQVVFYTDRLDRGQKTRLALLDLDDTSASIKSLSSSSASQRMPCWSPDGRWIAFAQAVRNNYGYILDWGLFRLDMDNGAIVALTNPPALTSDLDPCWSRDGRYLVFSREHVTDEVDRLNEYSLCRIDLRHSPENAANGYSSETIMNLGEGVSYADIHPYWVEASNVWIDQSELRNARVGKLYYQGFDAMGGTVPYKWSLKSGETLPEGLNIDSNGTIFGSPTTPGVYSFDVSVIDSIGSQDEDKFSLKIKNEHDLSLEEGDLKPAIHGQPYNDEIIINGGVPPYKLESFLGADSWLQYRVDGNRIILSGNPGRGGQLNLTLRVSDKISDQIFGRFRMPVIEMNKVEGEITDDLGRSYYLLDAGFIGGKLLVTAAGIPDDQQLAAKFISGQRETDLGRLSFDGNKWIAGLPTNAVPSDSTSAAGKILLTLQPSGKSIEFPFNIHKYSFRYLRGFSFENPSADYLDEDMFERLFGDEATEYGLNLGFTELRWRDPVAQYIFDEFYKKLAANGACFGMTLAANKLAIEEEATSYRPYSGRSIISSWIVQPWAESGTCRNNICYGDSTEDDSVWAASVERSTIGSKLYYVLLQHGWQLDLDVLLHYADFIYNHGFDQHNMAEETLRQVREWVRGGDKSHPIIISIAKGLGEGHALTAYAVEDISPSEALIRVYDSNRPFSPTEKNDSGSAINVHKNLGNQWSYDMGNKGIWRNSYIIPLPSSMCTGDATVATFWDIGDVLIDVIFIITSSQGVSQVADGSNRTLLTEEGFFNIDPGSNIHKAIAIPAISGEKGPSIILLPKNKTYSLDMGAETAGYNVSLILNKDFICGISRKPSINANKDILRLNSDRSALELRSKNGGSYEFKISQINASGGSQTAIVRSFSIPERQSLTIERSGPSRFLLKTTSSSASYDLSLDYITSEGQSGSASYGLQKISQGKTHILTLPRTIGDNLQFSLRA